MRLAAFVFALLTLAACAPTAPTGPPMPPPRVRVAPPTPTAPVSRGPRAPDRPKNLVLFIADGFGPASATMGRAAKGAPLAFDSLLVGSVETSATDSRVTDSAASATAYACGVKTYNGAIGMTPDGAPCTTILERAEAAGMSTGLVATSRITHATPASFAAHVAQRSQEDEIARQMVFESGVDLLLGGGGIKFAGETGFWTNRSSALGEIERLGAQRGPTGLLFSADHLAYEIDRDPMKEPSLAEMTERALDLLDAHAGDAGFFVMIEGSRIDHAGHSNDPAAHLGDILAYDAAVAAALVWAAADGETLVVSTADHETGGMSLGADGVYAWDPAPLLAATASFDGMGARLVRGEDPATVVREGLGLDALDPDDQAALVAAVDARDTDAARAAISAAASRAANIGWTTGGHTAVDVGLYAYGPGADGLRGAMPNDELGRRLAAILLGDD